MEFQFTKVNFDAVRRTVSLGYRFQDGEEVFYTETLQLPLDWPLRAIPPSEIQSILDSLHLACGIGYWKLRAAEKVKTEASLTADQVEFWNIFYSEGMGEFYYTNKLPFLRNLFNSNTDRQEKCPDFKFSERVLVGVSGGKDSLVTVEALISNGIEFTPFLVRTNGQKDSVDPIFAALGRKPLIVERILDSKLLAPDAGYRGHVPISAIYAFIGVLCGVLYDFGAFIVSNESSSNDGNIEYLGININHQWSKSWRFEQLFRDYCESFLAPQFSYFSFLRPLGELAIMQYFARSPQWHKLFSSCNRVLRQRRDKNRWCGECPKCAFAFVLLAAFLERGKVLDIIGVDMFEKPELIPLFDELLGRSGIKPFDCVGTAAEVQAAFCLIAEKEHWNSSLLMQHIASFLPVGEERQRLIEHEFALAETASIPQPWTGIFKNSFYENQ